MKSFKRHIPIYLIMLPALLYFLVFHYLPMVGIIIAFKDVSPYAGVKGMFQSDWVGFDNFRKFFNSYYFWNLLKNTLTISLKKLVVSFPASIILAILLNELYALRFKKVVQTISYLPHFISTVIVAGLVTTLLSTNGGLVNNIRQLFGQKPVHFLGRPEYFHLILVVSHTWKTVGWGTIIYLAALSGVDTQLYEAAAIDGANRWQRIMHITLPSITFIISINLILAIGNILNAGFEMILLLYSPATYSVGDIIDTYVYREGIANLKYSYTTAVSLFKSITSLTLVLIANFITKKLGQEGIW
jgi:putative aldouronate transport system permease protein